VHVQIARLLALFLVAAALGACTDTEQKIAQHRQRAADYVAQQQWAEAKIELLNLLKLVPDDAEAHHEYGQVLFRLEQYGDGLWQLQEAVRLAPERLDWRLELGQVLFAARQYDQALDQVEAILKAEPRNVRALLLRGGVRSVKGDTEGLVADIDAALAVEPDNKAALLLKAETLLRSKDDAGAEEHLRRLLAVDSGSSSHLMMARFLAGRGRHDEALKEYYAAIEAASGEADGVRARMQLANYYLVLRDQKSAFEVMEKAREAYPTNSEVLLTLARLHYGAGNRERAEQLLEQHAQSRPEDPEPLIVLAEFYQLIDDRKQALATLDRALELQPTHERARLRRAEYLYGDQQADASARDEAWSIVRSVLEKNPNSTLGHFTESKLLLLEGRFEEAATALRLVIEEQPSSNAHLLLGTAYQNLGQREQARSEYQQALQLDAQNYRARAQLAGLYLLMDQSDLAVREAQELVARRPDDARARLILASAQLRQGKLQDARTSLEWYAQDERVAGLEPAAQLDLARVHFSAADLGSRGARVAAAKGDAETARAERARVEHDLGRARALAEPLLARPAQRAGAREVLLGTDMLENKPQAALARLDAWIAQDPEQAELYLARGQLRMRQAPAGRPVPAEAEADLQAAIAKGLGDGRGHIELARYYQRTGALPRAIETLQAGQKAAPQDANVPLLLGGLYEEAGRPGDARGAYEAALRLDQAQPVAKNNLAWLLASAESPSEQDLDRALQLAQDAKEALPSSPQVADTLGYVMLRKNIPSAAIALFREAADAYSGDDGLRQPARGAVLYHLALAYERNGEVERAIAELQRALAEVPAFAERDAAQKKLDELKAS
jgi:tetratricopeptide (TPR) repeat protein